MENKKQLIQSDFKNTSTFSENGVYLNLPELLRASTQHHIGKRRMQDILLFSMLHILSACMPNVFGYYFGKKVYPNLYGFIGGPPATGKSVMLHTKSIGLAIDRKLNDLREKEMEDDDDSIEVKKRELFFLPANSSSAGIIKLLAKSGRGMIMESEIDVLVQILSQKFGDFSDLLRMVYHHEPYSYFRKTKDEHYTLYETCLTLLMSGTPGQIKSLLKSAENGLFSRISFYVYEDTSKFENPFEIKNAEVAKTFKMLSENICEMYFKLQAGEPKEFKFTEEQIVRFNSKFKEQLEDCQLLTGSDGASIIVRQGIIFFRIAMILSTIRNHDNNLIICSDMDFETTDKIVKVLSEHSLTVYSCLPALESEINGTQLSTLGFLNQLPPEFSTTSLIAPMLKRGISRRVAFRLIQELLKGGHIKKIRLGHYEKVNKSQTPY